MIKNLFITGNVGVGKTTLIKETVLPFSSEVGGFYTEEILKDGKRQGFKLKTFDGREGVFALKGRKNPVRFGKYGIDTNVLESIGVIAMKEAMRDKKIIVIDEIGSMEILSQQFHAQLMACLLSAKYVLATVRYSSQPFSEDILRLPEQETIVLTKEKFNNVRMRVRKWVQSCLRK